MFSSDRTFALRVRKIGSLLRRLERLEERATPTVSSWWGDLGIGQPSLVGATTGDTAGTIVVQGGGLGFNSASADQFHFRYKELSGDGFVSAKVGSVIDADASAAGGLMMRGSTAANSAFAALTKSPNGVWTFQYRASASGAVMTATYAGPAVQYAKLVRNGPLFSGYVSTNGQDGTWQLVGSGAIASSNTIDVGLAVTSYSSGTLANASFENVAIGDPPPVGAGLDGVIDWSLSNAFVDMTKQSREFMQADGFQPVNVDANGWPTADTLMIFQTGTVGNAHIYNGTYKLSFTGQATIDKWVSPATITNVQYNAATNTTTAHVNLNASQSADYYLGLVFRNSKRTPSSAAGSGVTNVRMIRPGYDPASAPTFTTQFTAHLKSFSTLRFMDWLETNNSNIVNWSQRTPATYARQTITGVAWEYVVQLANQMGKDLWINIPAQATDDYVRNLATLLKSSVNPDRAIYVEYSNEVWNWGFQQTGYNYNRATAQVQAGNSPLNADGETNAGFWAWRRVGERTKQISDIFRAVWGDAAINSRIRVVLAGQSANPETFRQGLKLIRQTWGDPSQYIYGLAGAPYFSLGSIDAGNNLTNDQVIDALQSAMQNTPSVMNYAVSVSLALENGMKFMAYEGGPDTFGGNNIAAKKASQLDPRIAGIITNYLTQWFQSGGSLFNWFVAGATSYDTPYGTWGLTNDITNTNTPKIQGIDAVMNAAMPAFQSGLSVPSTFSSRAEVGVANASGNRYAGPGDNLHYILRAPVDGAYTFSIRYATDQGGRALRISSNGKVVQSIALPTTATWDTFADSIAITLQLNAGANALQIEIIGGGLQLGDIRIITNATRTLLSGSANSLTANVATFNGAAANGLVQFFDGATMIGTANLDATGKATLSLTNVGAGNHVYTAVYSGAGGLIASTSPGFSRAASGTIIVTNPTTTPNTTKPTIADLVIGDGTTQRSMVRSIQISFDRAVVLAAGAFELYAVGGFTPAFSVSTALENGKTIATLSFNGSSILGGSLPDGQYTLRVIASRVTDAANPALSLNSERIEAFHRLFGDYDGNRTVDLRDYARFQSVFANQEQSLTASTTISPFDADGDGDVDALDLRQLNRRYGRGV